MGKNKGNKGRSANADMTGFTGNDRGSDDAIVEAELAAKRRELEAELVKKQARLEENTRQQIEDEKALLEVEAEREIEKVKLVESNEERQLLDEIRAEKAELEALAATMKSQSTTPPSQRTTPSDAADEPAKPPFPADEPPKPSLDDGFETVTRKKGKKKKNSSACQLPAHLQDDLAAVLDSGNIQFRIKELEDRINLEKEKCKAKCTQKLMMERKKYQEKIAHKEKLMQLKKEQELKSLMDQKDEEVHRLKKQLKKERKEYRAQIQGELADELDAEKAAILQEVKVKRSLKAHVSEEPDWVLIETAQSVNYIKDDM